METRKVNFPPILGENEKTYFSHIEGIVEAIDPYASILFTKASEGMKVRIFPSVPILFNSILTEIKRIHTIFGIQVEFSKSMKAGHNIFFVISLP